MLLHHQATNRELARSAERFLARAAFTLMEMLIVVAIIVALAGIGGYYLLGALSQSKEGTAKAQAVTLYQAVQSYATQHGGQYPQSLEELAQPDPLTNRPYLEKREALMDPWGRPYQYNPSAVSNTGAPVPEIFCINPENNKKISNH